MCIRDSLKRHPKRIVFPEGEDVRVLRVSERFVAAQAGVPILLGRKEVIRRMAEMNGISPVSYTHLDVYKRQAFWPSSLTNSASRLFPWTLAQVLSLIHI